MHFLVSETKSYGKLLNLEILFPLTFFSANNNNTNNTYQLRTYNSLYTQCSEKLFDINLFSNMHIFNFHNLNKSYLRYICFTKSTSVFLWNPLFNFCCIERFRSLYFLLQTVPYFWSYIGDCFRAVLTENVYRVWKNMIFICSYGFLSCLHTCMLSSDIKRANRQNI